MIARLWTPARSGVARSQVLSLAIAAVPALPLALVAPDARPAASAAWVLLSAIGVAATVGNGGAAGPYAASAATGLVWAAAAFVAAGAIGAPVVAALTALAALCTTLGTIPLAERLRRATPSERAATPAGVGVGLYGTELASQRRAALICTALVAFGLIMMCAATWPTDPGADPAVHPRLWPAVAGWLSVQAMLTQRLIPTAVFAVALAVALATALATGGAAGGLAFAPLLGVGLAASWVIRHALTTPFAGRSVEVAGGVLFATVAVAAALGLAPAPYGAACLLAGVAGIGALGVEWWDRSRAAVRPAADAMASVRRALFRLDPYPRWYGLSKLGTDPVYRTLAGSDHRWGDVLDIGAGMGLASAIAAGDSSAATLTLVDLDAEKLAAASRLLRALGVSDQRTSVVVGAFPTDAIRERRFDTILLLDVLHYAPLETQQELLGAASERLAPGGRILLRDPVARADATGEVSRIERWTTRFGFNPIGDTRYLSEAEWAAVFAGCGLDVAERRECGHDNVLFTLQRTG